MKIGTRYIGASGQQEPLPSNQGFDGEIEDYSLNVLPSVTVQEFGFENLLIYPNPNHGTFTVELQGSLDRDITIEVYDVSGKFINKLVYPATGDFNEQPKLDTLMSGMYFLRINDGIKTAVKKIIVY